MTIRICVAGVTGWAGSAVARAVIAFETIFGLPHERLSIRHDAGSGAEPYVAGSLLALREVLNLKGLIRGLDTLLFKGGASPAL